MERRGMTDKSDNDPRIHLQRFVSVREPQVPCLMFAGQARVRAAVSFLRAGVLGARDVALDGHGARERALLAAAREEGALDSAARRVPVSAYRRHRARRALHGLLRWQAPASSTATSEPDSPPPPGP